MCPQKATTNMQPNCPDPGSIAARDKISRKGNPSPRPQYNPRLRLFTPISLHVFVCRHVLYVFKCLNIGQSQNVLIRVKSILGSILLSMAAFSKLI